VQLNGKVNYSVPEPNPPGAVSTTPTTAFAGIEPLKDPDALAVTNLAWEADRILVGDPIEGMFTAKNFKGGEKVTVTVYEFDTDGQKNPVDTILLTLSDEGTGHYGFIWKRTAQQVSQDQKEDEAAGDTGPLNYRFHVEIGGVKSAEASGSLWLTKTMVINTSKSQDKGLAEGTEVICKMADGSKLYQTVTKSVVTFKNVLVGPVEFIFDEKQS